ncbi:MAG: hypothetical protein JXA49_03735 [Actinobacteria bacterium]|nr:hypothetical protein [Actinomycetota bacterium]
MDEVIPIIILFLLQIAGGIFLYVDGLCKIKRMSVIDAVRRMKERDLRGRRITSIDDYAGLKYYKSWPGKTGQGLRW